MNKPIREGWKKVSSVGMIESTQEIKDKVSVERRYFIVNAGVRRSSNSPMPHGLTGA